MKKEKNTVLVAIIILLVILVFLVSLVGYLRNTSSEKALGNITIQNGIIETDIDYDEVANDVMSEKLLSMGERDRMEYYISNFINLIEKKEYEKAYDLLYEDFKNTYFPTAGQFQTYAKKYFPSMASLDFTNIERNGDVYVLWVTITDPINGKKSDDGKEYNFVIRENDVNDIDLSFSVEEE